VEMPTRRAISVCVSQMPRVERRAVDSDPPAPPDERDTSVQLVFSWLLPPDVCRWGQRDRSRFRKRLIFWQALLAGSADLGTTASQKQFKSVSQIVHQMIAIGHLQRLGSGFSRGRCVIGGSVATDHPDRGMRTQPRCKG
jgi:hypothetical protein